MNDNVLTGSSLSGHHGQKEGSNYMAKQTFETGLQDAPLVEVVQAAKQAMVRCCSGQQCYVKKMYNCRFLPGGNN